MGGGTGYERAAGGVYVVEARSEEGSASRKVVKE